MSMAYNPNNRPAAPTTTSRPDSMVSDISDDVPDGSPDAEIGGSGRGFVPSLSSDRSFTYQHHAESPTDDDSLYHRPPGGPPGELPGEPNQKYISPSQASEAGDASLSEIADAYRNHAILSGTEGGRRTPRGYERGEVTSEVVEGLQEEIETLRTLIEQEQGRRKEMTEQFKKWKDIMTHNTKALIQNSRVNLHKNYMRIHPLLNDDGDYPDMVVFPTTVGSLMKMNEAHLTRLVVFYDLQADQIMDYYAKYCALRDHLGIEP